MKEEIREFLNTGLLEQYVLGLTDLSETRRVESFIQKYPEVQSIYADLQDGMARLAAESAVDPPPDVKQFIMSTIDAPMGTPQPAPKIQKFNWTPFLAVASAALLALAGYFWNNSNTTQNELTSVKQEYNAYQAECEKNQQTYAQLQAQFDYLNDPKTGKFCLKGNQKSNAFEVIAYWNDDQQKSMLRVLDLPQLPEKQCFQMWADVHGEMVNLGVIQVADNQALIDFSYLADAESLNVTIEPLGGSDHPNVANLVANVSI